MLSLFLLIPSILIGLAIGFGSHLITRRMAPGRKRRIAQIIGLAAAISPFGFCFGPECEAFIPAPAFAVSLVSFISVICGDGGRSVEYFLGSILAITVTSIAIFIFSSVWNGLRNWKWHRISRAVVLVVVVVALVNYFLVFEIYRAKSSSGFLQIPDTEWEVRAFAIAIPQQSGRWAYRRLFTDYQYSIYLKVAWKGVGKPPDEPDLLSAKLVQGKVKTPLAVSDGQIRGLREDYDDYGQVPYNIKLMNPNIIDMSRNPVPIPWWPPQVELVLLYDCKSSRKLIIPLQRKERLIPHYSPVFGFKLWNPF